MKDWQIRQETMLPGSCDALAEKRVAVIGIGGVGAYICEALARAGVGGFVLADGDVVSASDINRQLIAAVDTVGKSKTETMKNRILSVNPEADVICADGFLTKEDVPPFLEKYKPDFVADAVDTVAVKIAFAAECEKTGIPLVAVMGTGNKIHPELFEISDIYKTSVCPLCRAMRTRLKNEGVKSLAVVYSREQPFKAVAESEHGRHAPASVSFVPPAAGMTAAGYIVRTLLGI